MSGPHDIGSATDPATDDGPIPVVSKVEAATDRGNGVCVKCLRRDVHCAWHQTNIIVLGSQNATARLPTMSTCIIIAVIVALIGLAL